MEIVEEYSGNDSNEIQVLVVAPFTLLGAGLQKLIDGMENISASGTSSNKKELTKLLDALKPDQVLLVKEMSGSDNLEMVLYLADHYPHIKVILVSENQHPGFIAQAFSSGVCGYLGKHTCIRELETAIRQIDANGLYHNRDSITALYNNKSMEEKAVSISAPGIHLTSVEIQVLDLIYQGYNDNQIGAVVCKSGRTVQGYKRKLMAKFGVKKTSMVILKAIESGWLVKIRRDQA